MTAPDLARLLRSNVSIPTVPEVVQKVQGLLADPEVGTREIGAVVAQDAPLAAKVLRIVNSAWYGLANPCLSTEHASSVLGVKVLRNIVAQVSVMQQFEHLNGFQGFQVSELWEHAVRTARVAARLAGKAGVARGMAGDDFHTCGLLHDVGKVVLLDALGEQWTAVCRTADVDDASLCDREREAFGFDHAEVGSAVASRWGLPEDLCEAVRLHHRPAAELTDKPLALLVAVADQVAHALAHGEDPMAAVSPAAGPLGLDLGSLESLAEAFEEDRSVDL